MIKVLIVEDDPMVAKFHSHYLSQVDGFELIGIVKNGEECLNFLSKANVNLVLMDIFMPGIDGLQLLSQIRSLEYSVDVIVISAASDSARIKRALRNGAVDYLIKPFEFERFSTSLLNYKNRAMLMDEYENLNQEDLDKNVLYKEQAEGLVLPKGLDHNTLKMVWEKVVELNEPFTTEQMAAFIGISRVSIRKYLEFLTSLQILKLDLHRGAVGRPVYKYKCIDKSIHMIQHYF